MSSINSDSVLKHLDFRENRAGLENFARDITYGLVRFHHVEISPGVDESGVGVYCRRSVEIGLYERKI
jgi:hypothetical protein